MNGAAWRSLILALVLAGSAWGQFELYLVNGNIEQPVPHAYDLGAVEPGSSITVLFRIRNVSANAATLDFLQVNGSGFAISNLNRPVLPVSLASQKSVDLTVLFQSAGTGFYSAALDSVGIAVLLSVNVPMELTSQLETGTGTRPLAAAPVDFGVTERGSVATRHIVLMNQTSAALAVPGLLVSGADFSLGGSPPGGTLVQPTASTGFDILFSPTADGASTGMLSIGGRSYLLAGTAVEPDLPRPRISLALAQAGSAQQGSVTVNLDAPSRAYGSGTVAMTFLPARPATTDSGIAFATGGQSMNFAVSPGDTQGHFGMQLTAPFQTGTTAGTLTISVQLGGNTDQQSIAILPAVVGVTAAQGGRSTGLIEVNLTGFDNTRTAGALAFTFFDGAGNVVGSVIHADGAAGFASYFQNSPGGTFALKAVFPVAGDASLIKAFEAAVTNSAGSAATARTSF